MNKNHLLITLILFCTAKLQAQIFVPYRIDSLWGISDYQGNILIEPRYNEVSFVADKFFDFSYNSRFSGLALELHKGDKEGVFYGVKIIIPVRYDDVSFEDNLWTAWDGNKSEFYNNAGINLLGDTLEVENNEVKHEPRPNLAINREIRLIQFRSNSGHYYVRAYNSKQQTFSKIIMHSAYQMNFYNFLGRKVVKGNSNLPSHFESTIQVACSIIDSNYTQQTLVFVLEENGNVHAVPASEIQLTAMHDYRIKSERRNRFDSDGAASGRWGDGDFSNTKADPTIYNKFYLKNQKLWKMQYRQSKKPYLIDTLVNEIVNCVDCSKFKVVEYDSRFTDANNKSIKQVNFVVFQKNKKWHFLSSCAGFKLGYDTIVPVSENYSRYNHIYKTGVFNKEKQLKFGLIDVSKCIELPAEFDRFSTFGHFPSVAYKGSKAYLFSEDLKIYSSGYDLIKKFDDSYNSVLVFEGNLMKILWISDGQVHHQSPWFNKSLTVATPIYFKELYLYPIFNNLGKFLGYINDSGIVFYK